MKKRILVVGHALPGFLESLESRGYDYIVLKDRLRTQSPHKRLPRRIVCDFSSRESILKTVGTITQRIDGVLVTPYENYILPAAWIAAHLHLPGLPIETAKACTDKQLMRTLFAKAPERISPEFAVVTHEHDLQAFALRHQFPLILKPASLAKSLLVTKNHTLDELHANYRRTVAQIEEVYQKYAPTRQPKLLVEEFLEGSIHSVDAFVGHNGQPHLLQEIVDYQSGYDIGFDDNFHYSRLLPSKLSSGDQQALRHCAALGIQALGMRNSPAHVEVIMTKEGPRIVEIGARNGGYRNRMHKLANGIDIASAATSLVFGEEPDITATKHEPCAVLEFFPKQPGIFQRIQHQAKMESLASRVYLSVKAEPGDYVGKAADGYKMCAVVILHHHDPVQFQHDLEFVNQNVRVETEPSQALREPLTPKRE